MKPEILFDHFYVVLSPVQYEALKNDDLWKQYFCSAYESTVTTGEGNRWTGLYCTALNHRYAEFFYEGPRVAENYFAGAAGIGLCSEFMGVADAASAYFNEHSKSQPSEIVPRTIMSKALGTQIPWFTYMAAKALDKPFLKTWLMDYAPEYVEVAKVPLKSKHQFDRDQFALCKFEVKPEQPQVTGFKSLTIDCLESEFEFYSNSLLGMTFRKESDFIFVLPDVTLKLNVVSNVSMRVSEVELTLSQPASTVEHSVADGVKFKVQDSRLILSLRNDK